MRLEYGQEKRLVGPKAKKLPVYVLHGKQEFLLKEFAKKLTGFLNADDEYGSGYQRIDGAEEKALERIADAAGERSLFADRQVIVVDAAQDLLLKRDESTKGKKNVPDEEKFTNYYLYKKILDAVGRGDGGVSIVFIVEDQLRAPSANARKSTSEKVVQRAFAEFDRHGAVVSFPNMYERDIAAWVTARARREGVMWGREMPEKLIEWAGDDLRHLANEIEKLSNYFSGGGEMSELEIRRLVSNSEDFFIFFLMDCMFSGRGKAAVSTLNRSLAYGSVPVQIMTMISSRLRQLWQLRFLMEKGYFRSVPKKYGGAAKAAIAQEVKRVSPADAAAIAATPKDSILKKTPFMINEVMKYARTLPLSDIEDLIARAGDVDRRLKGIERPKRGTDEIMLQSYVVDVASRVRTPGAAASPS